MDMAKGVYHSTQREENVRARNNEARRQLVYQTKNGEPNERKPTGISVRDNPRPKWYQSVFSRGTLTSSTRYAKPPIRKRTGRRSQTKASEEVVLNGNAAKRGKDFGGKGE